MTPHLSAFREQQRAVQDATDQAREDAINDVRRWLEERSGTPSFNEVRVAFMADWFEQPAAAGQGQAAE